MLTSLNSTRNLISLQRTCQGITGLITLIILIKFSDGESLGWYYSVLSLAALHVIFDHGLSGILVNKAANDIPNREMTHFNDLSPQEKKSFHRLCHASFKVYLKIAAAFLAIVTPLGLYFFAQASGPFIHWQTSWVVLVSVLALNLLLLPFRSIIEGAGAIRQVYIVRLIQSAIGPVVCWITIMNGHLLWATIASPLVVIIIQLIWLMKYWKEAFALVIVRPSSEIIWSRIMLPFETRAGVTFMCGHILGPVITLFLFQTHGAIAAGTIAVSLAIANTLALISFSAITSVTPQITKDVALRNWKNLDRTYRKVLLNATGMYFFGTVLYSLIYLTNDLAFIANRTLSIEFMYLLFVSIFASHIVSTFIAKTNAYLKDPLMPIVLFSTVIMIALILLLAPKGGVTSAVLILFFVEYLVVIPGSYLLFRKFEKRMRFFLDLKSKSLSTQTDSPREPSEDPKIAILMTTFNGSDYIEQQLLSIENQTYRNWVLHVSDDGSTDSTLTTLEAFASKHIGRVFIYQTDSNLGFVGNFFSLICNSAIREKYYALCDQDDIWGINKLSTGIEQICEFDSQTALYCSRTLSVDSVAANYLEYSPFFGKPLTFENAIVQSIAGGNTMVFNHLTKQLVIDSSHRNTLGSLPSHDWWIYLLVSGHGGLIKYDPIAHILYRQHSKNIVGTNVGLRASLLRLLMLKSGRFRTWNQLNIEALCNCRELLTAETNNALQDFMDIRDAKLSKRLMNLFKTQFYRQTLLANITLKIALLFKRI